MLKQLLAAAAALTLLAPIAAQAQEVPSYADAASTDLQIQGRIASFDGGYNLTVRDDNGYTDIVQLHDGTIINPTGLTLAPGMVVSVLGQNDGSYFAANEVDTPYTIDAGVPYYVGHPWDYYGPTISLGFFFGNTGWWHHNYPIARGSFGWAHAGGGYSYNPPSHFNTIVNVHDGGNYDRNGGGNNYRSEPPNHVVSVGPERSAPVFQRSAPVRSAPAGGRSGGGSHFSSGGGHESGGHDRR